MTVRPDSRPSKHTSRPLPDHVLTLMCPQVPGLLDGHERCTVDSAQWPLKGAADDKKMII